MLKNQNVFITGSNRGIGKALLTKFAENKANIICASRKVDKEFLNFVNLLKNKTKSKITILEFDLSNFLEMKNAINSINKKNLSIDILINNAGVASGSILEMTSIKKLKEIFEINYFSQISLIQLLLKFIKKSKNGCIINIGSISGIIPERGTLAYGSSKAAFMFSTRVMANELSPYGIRVNSIAPSIINTDMSELMNIKAKEELINQSFEKKIGNVDDVAELALFLSSKKSKHLNGQIIRLDGGMKI